MKSLYFLSFLLLLFFISCKKEEIYSPNLKGSIIGNAFLYDEYGVLSDDNSGIKITAEGYKNYTGITDFYGRFELKNIPTGTYVITAEKEGFGKLKRYGVQHLGGTPTILELGNITGRAPFSLMPKSSIKIQEVYFINNSFYARVESKASIENVFIFIHFYYSANPEVNTSTNSFTDAQFVRAINSNTLTGEWLNNFSFPAGRKIYVKACIQVIPRNFYNPLTFNLLSYEDPETHQLIIPNLGDVSSEFSFIVPQ